MVIENNPLIKFARVFKRKFTGMSVMKQLALGFAAIVLTGGILLMLPISSRSGVVTPFIDAVFTATTATCVTGLTVVDTYLYWSLFGQLVILVLIQIGGVGFITLVISAITLTKKKIGLRQRLAMREVAGANQVGGIVKVTRFIIFGTFIIESAGALLLSTFFVPKLGLLKGIYFSIFHSVSAFCNAGIDLMSYFKQGSSLITVNDNIIFNVTIMALIVIGGLGFLVWSDVVHCKCHFKKFRLHTKIVLSTTLILILGGALVIFIFENNGEAFRGMNLKDSIMASFFQSVTTRTAGFYSVDLPSLREPTILVMVVLMLVGGSPASTAGGIKTTSVAVLFLSIFLVFRNRESVECYKRRIAKSALTHACCILMLFLVVVFAATISISYIENLPILAVLYETSSAMATVGLSLGITPHLSVASKIILILLMYVGRVGALTMLLFFSKNSTISSKYPEEKITIG